MQVWAEPFTNLRVPKIFNLRLDPYERASETSNTYFDWMLDHAFMLVPAQRLRRASSWRPSRSIPPRQKAASFTVGDALKKLQAPDGD